MTTGKDTEFDLDTEIENDQTAQEEQDLDPQPKPGDGERSDAGEKDVSDKLDQMLAEEDKEQEEKPAPAAKPGKGKEAAPTQDPATKQRTGQHSYSADGSVVGPDGKIIAKAGSERRHWEEARRQAQRAAAAEGKINEANQRVAQAEQYVFAGKQLGLAADEQIVALRYFAWFKKAPEEALKYLLTDAQAKGYNMTTILGDYASGGVNMEAVGKMVQNAVKPIVDREQQAERQRQSDAEAAQEVSQLYSDFPNAPVHEDLIVKVMQQIPTLSLREAYLRIENWGLQNGLDVSRPLQPQLDAKKAGQTLAASRRNVTNFPRGRGGQMETVRGTPGAFNEFNTDSIVASAMRESGLDPKRF